MSTWTPELRELVIQKYKAANPTAANTTEIIKEIADEIEQSPNGIRMILIQSGDYVKKDAPTETTKKSSTKEGGTKRVSKESLLQELKNAIEAKGGNVDDDIVDKLTGKAAVYFTELLTAK